MGVCTALLIEKVTFSSADPVSAKFLDTFGAVEVSHVGRNAAMVGSGNGG